MAYWIQHYSKSYKLLLANSSLLLWVDSKGLFDFFFFIFVLDVDGFGAGLFLLTIPEE
jgi:hypothetical protein